MNTFENVPIQLPISDEQIAAITKNPNEVMVYPEVMLRGPARFMFSFVNKSDGQIIAIFHTNKDLQETKHIMIVALVSAIIQVPDDKQLIFLGGAQNTGGLMFVIYEVVDVGN